MVPHKKTLTEKGRQSGNAGSKTFIAAHLTLILPF